jgi:hypothetical protein
MLAVLTLVTVLTTGCTGHHDEPAALSHPTRAGLRVDGEQPAGDPTGAPDDGASLSRALEAMPPSVLYASFTDVAAVRRELGYEQTDSGSPAAERFGFWEDARSSGTMLTGARLYDDISGMDADYGWSADDVVWEIDFTGSETGCTEDMLCDPSNGSVLSLRPAVDERDVVQSLAANGFTLQSGEHVWTTDRTDDPFMRAVYLPELNAIALGNAIGLRRISEVAGGAPSLADQLPSLATQLGSPLSAYIDTTGCVSLGEALGPDATEADISAFAKSNDAAHLAPATAWAATIDSARTATSLLDLAPVDGAATASPDEETRRRAEILDNWTSVQAGIPFDDVAAGEVSVEGSIERVRYHVRAMPAFAAMVLAHDAPWALCATSAAT